MSKFYPLSVAKVHHETRDAIAVTFAVPPELADSFTYQQGQHLTLRAQIEEQDVRRSYSICSWDPLESTCRHASLSIL